MKYLKYIFLLLLALIDGYIIYQSCLDSNVSSQTSSNVTEVVIVIVDTVTPSKESIIDIYGVDSVHLFVRKAIGHFGLFFVSAIFSYLLLIYMLNKKKIIYIIHFVHGFFLAVITEIIQLFANGRSGEWTDSLIDYSGYLASSLIIITIYILFKKRHGGKQDEKRSS